MIDPNKPVYLRLRETIANAILDGKFVDGDMLPSVRALAAEEGANPLTVANELGTTTRSYDKLNRLISDHPCFVDGARLTRLSGWLGAFDAQ